MKKRCIWNYVKKKKIECLDEKRKRSRFFVVLSFWGGIVIEIGIPIIILIVLLLDAIINKHMPFQNAMFSTGIQFIVLLPFMSFWEYIVYTQIYNDMISNGVYYLNERGIQLEYYPNICKEMCWEEIEFIERRTILNDVREGRQASECEIFFICKKGCTEKEKKVKTRGEHFFVNHRKKIIYIGYSKEREEEFRQYWDKEIRDQRKWTRGMNLF